NDRVLFPPTKLRNRIQIVVVKKMFCNAGTTVGAVQWAVDQFGQQVEQRRWRLREMQKEPAIDTRAELFAQRIDEARNPFVVLRAVNPGRNVSSHLNLRRQRTK